jgi:hypothetical protein
MRILDPNGVMWPGSQVEEVVGGIPQQQEEVVVEHDHCLV